MPVTFNEILEQVEAASGRRAPLTFDDALAQAERSATAQASASREAAVRPGPIPALSDAERAARGLPPVTSPGPEGTGPPGKIPLSERLRGLVGLAASELNLGLMRTGRGLAENLLLPGSRLTKALRDAIAQTEMEQRFFREPHAGPAWKWAEGVAQTVGGVGGGLPAFVGAAHAAAPIATMALPWGVGPYLASAAALGGAAALQAPEGERLRAGAIGAAVGPAFHSVARLPFARERVGGNALLGYVTGRLAGMSRPEAAAQGTIFGLLSGGRAASAEQLRAAQRQAEALRELGRMADEAASAGGAEPQLAPGEPPRAAAEPEGAARVAEAPPTEPAPPSVPPRLALGPRAAAGAKGKPEELRPAQRTKPPEQEERVPESVPGVPPGEPPPPPKPLPPGEAPPPPAGPVVVGRRTGRAEFQGRLIYPVSQPHLVELAKALTGGGLPKIAKGLIGKAYAAFVPRRGGQRDIQLGTELARLGEEQATPILAHEIGHAEGWLPKNEPWKTVAEFVTKVKGWSRRLPKDSGFTESLDPAERGRLEGWVRLLASEDAPKRIDEMIPARTMRAPDEALSTFLDAVGRLRLSRQLSDYAGSLSDAERKSIALAALAGETSLEPPRFVKAQVRLRGRGAAKAPDADIVRRVGYELALRHAFESELMGREVRDFSYFWRPLDPVQATQKDLAYRGKPGEQWADFISGLLTAPKEVVERAPVALRGLFRWLDARPEMARAYNRIQSVFALGEKAAAAEREAARLAGYAEASKKSTEALLKEAEARKTPLWSAALEWFINEDEAARVYAREAKRQAKQGGPPLKRAYHPDIWWDEWKLMSSGVQKLLDSVAIRVEKPLHDANIARTDFDQYLELDAIVNQRRFFWNPGGQTRTTAATDLAILRRRVGPRGWAALQEAGENLHRLTLGLARLARREGIIDDPLMKRIEENRDHYAFFWVLSHVGAKVSPVIRAIEGTLEPVAGPYSATVRKSVAMLYWIELEKARGAALGLLRSARPELVRPHKEGEPVSPGMGLIQKTVAGKRHEFEVPARFAELFERKEPISAQALLGATNLLRSLFHAVYVKYSPGFPVMNPLRDVPRMTANVPRSRNPILAAIQVPYDFARAVYHYAAMLPHGWRATDVSKGLGPAHKQALAMREIGPTWQRHGLSSETEVLDHLLAQYGYGPKGAVPLPPVLRQIKAGLDWFARIAEMEEYAGKFAAERLARSRIPDWRERALWVRRKGATPFYQRGGRAKSVLNTIAMYANVNLQGFLEDMATLLKPRTAAGFALFVGGTQFGPKIMEMMAERGMMGERLKTWMSLMPQYYKDKFILIPFGFRTNRLTGRTEAVGVRLPLLDSTRPFVAALREFGRTEEGWGRLTGAISAIEGELPSESSFIKIASVILQASAGGKPVDTWTGTQIVSEDAAKAFPRTPVPALKDVGLWTLNQFGAVSQAVRPFLPERGRRFDLIGRLLRMPGLSAILFSTDKGYYERTYRAVKLDEADEAVIRTGYVPGNARHMLAEHWRLSGMAEKGLSPVEAEELAILKAYRSRAYMPMREALTAAQANGDEKAMERISKRMERDADEAEDAIRLLYLGSRPK